MARAGRDLSNYIKAINDKLNSSGKDIQKFLKKRKGNLFLLPLKQRLLRGISGDGTRLAGYSDSYKLFKKEKGVRVSPTTLRLTGDWYDSMFVSFGLSNKRHVIEIKTRDAPSSEPESWGTSQRSIAEKTAYLKGKYGANILTMTKEEQEVIISEVEQFLIKSYNEIGRNILIELR